MKTNNEKIWRSDLGLWEETVLSRRKKIKGYRYLLFGNHDISMKKKYKSKKAIYLSVSQLPNVHDKNGNYLA